MKELSIEERARRYDEVREKIAIRFGSNVADEIFSQFEMSEDERIRKELITFFQRFPYERIGNAGTKVKEAIDWLEKQCEQKSVDDLTQQEAMDIAVAKCFNEQKPADTENGAKGNEVEIPISEPPLTIEHAREVMGIKQNPAWSEEDEENLNWFEKFFRAESVIAKGKDIPQDRYLWFANLKDRVQPQNTWKPSDEQMYNLSEAAHYNCAFFDMEILKGLYDDLKKLKG